MIGLTPRQHDLLTFLREWPHPWAPGYREIATGLGVASTANVGGWLKGLEERGFIRLARCAGGYLRARAIEVVPPPVIINGERFRFIPKSHSSSPLMGVN